jgi:hypothetical protein
MLVSEPSCCPYCQQPEFGVTYDPPAFRRGLAYTISPTALGAMGTAMSSHSSLNSATLSPPLASPTTGNRRRGQSLSVTDPTVITTDRVRPEWATKLQAARNHQARRAAAATALHTAAFLMGNQESRPFRVSRFSRRTTGLTPSATGGGNSAEAEENAEASAASGSGPDAGPRGNSGRGNTSGTTSNGPRSRIDDLEDMMFAEAVRLSLAAEEERKAKEEKERKKEAKRREKEERKAAKLAAKSGGPYGSHDTQSGHSSASGSSLSLSGFGRKRGNSGASNLRVEASVANAIAIAAITGTSPILDSNGKDKGKGVDRGLPSTPEGVENVAGESASSTSAPPASDEPPATTASSPMSIAIPASAPRPIPSPHHPIAPSHLRQMSSASSISSSLPDSQAGSYTSPSHLQDPRASGHSLGSRSAASDDGDQDRDPNASLEPMFNFRSLAAVVGVSLEGENAGRRLSMIEAERKAKESAQAHAEDDMAHKTDEANEPEVERIEDVETELGGSGADSDRPQENQQRHVLVLETRSMPPEVTITPGTPAVEHAGAESKQLGYEPTPERPQQATQ